MTAPDDVPPTRDHAAGCDAPSFDRWRAEVESTFAPGPDGDEHPGWKRLRARFAEGFTLFPLGMDDGRELAPILRGSRPERGWEIAQRIAVSSVDELVDAAREEFANDVDRVELVLADSSAQRSRDGLPSRGAVVDAQELARCLERLEPANRSRIVVDAGTRTAALAVAFGEQGRAIDGSAIEWAADPTGDALTQGGANDSAAWDDLATVLTSGRGGSCVTLSTGGIHEAGGHRAHELGALLSSTLATLKQLESRGVDPEPTLARARFDVRLGTHLYADAAKLRAWRLVWALFLEELGGPSIDVPIGASLSRRVLTRDDVWVNVLRASACAFSAAIGGADRVTLLPFDAVWGDSTPRSRRVTRNLHHVFQRESWLGEVDDPAAGSFSIEALTDELAERSWEVFRAIEARGGWYEGIRSGWLASEVQSARDAEQSLVARRRRPLTGVSEYATGRVELPFPDRDLPATPAEDSAPFAPQRLAADFERRVDRARGLGDARTVYLARLGNTARSGPRATFTENALAAGGLRVVDGEASDDPDEHAKQFTASGARVAVLCASDEDSAAHGPAVIEALAAAGAHAVWHAGPLQDPQAYSNALRGTLVFGQDLLTFLDDVLDAIQETTAGGAA